MHDFSYRKWYDLSCLYIKHFFWGDKAGRREFVQKTGFNPGKIDLLDLVEAKQKKLRKLIREDLGKWFDKYKSALRTSAAIEMFFEQHYKPLNTHLQQRVDNNPALIRNIVQGLHTSGEVIDDKLLDRLLTLDYSVDDKTDADKLESRYKQETLYLNDGAGVQTQYRYIRDFIRMISPKETDIVYDLGSGFGRVGYWGALTSPARFKGIELIEPRVEECNRVKQRIGAHNLEYIAGNVLDTDYSDGNIFFMYYPFCEETDRKVMQKLRAFSEQRPITLGVHSGTSTLIENLNWLKKVEFKDRKFGTSAIRIYRSKK